MGGCQTEQPLFDEEAVGPSERRILITCNTPAATTTVQETAQTHSNPSVQIFVEPAATAVLEVCEPAAKRPVQIRDDKRQRVTRVPFRPDYS